jgi:apolipoprotein N-acyltransferase
VDPFAPPPSFFREHGPWLAPLSVFLSTAILTVLSFPPYHAPEFAYVFAVPAIFWAYSRPSLRVFAWTLFAAQAVAWTVLLVWLRHVTWLGWLLLGPFVGAWVGVWYLAVWWAMPRFLGRPSPVRLAAQLGLAGAWVLVEWTRTWLITGFPWLPLAASQWQRISILQVASFTGAYGVSFVLIVANLGFAAYAHRLFREHEKSLFQRRSQEFMLAMLLLLGCLCLMVVETNGRRTFSRTVARVGFVQPDIPATIKWNPADAPKIARTLTDLTRAVAGSVPDLILWPESATPYGVRQDAATEAWVDALAAQAHAPLLIGTNQTENAGTPREAWYDAAVVAAPETGVQPGTYTKRHLVPFGEYVPLRPVLGWLGKFVPLPGDCTPGTDPHPLVVRLPSGALAFGPLICYEDIFPDLARASVRAGADVLAVLTNDAWYGEEGAAYQHAAHAVLRAVETRRPVLRCGNAGWSGWIDEFGGIRAVLTGEDGRVYFRGAGTADVSRDLRWAGVETFYVRHGDWFVLVSAGLVLFGLLLLRLEASLPGLGGGSSGR